MSTRTKFSHTACTIEYFLPNTYIKPLTLLFIRHQQLKCYCLSSQSHNALQSPYTHTHVCVHAQTYAYTRMRTCSQIHICTHTQMHALTHAHTHMLERILQQIPKLRMTGKLMSYYAPGHTGLISNEVIK